MKPEMEKLLQLFDEAQQSKRAEQLFEKQLDDLHSQYPEISREQLRRIIRTAYLRWLRASSKPPTIPPGN
jgi:ribosomal 50S subunit-associated protein YjgA (DUF615 family)